MYVRQLMPLHTIPFAPVPKPTMCSQNLTVPCKEMTAALDGLELLLDMSS